MNYNETCIQRPTATSTAIRSNVQSVVKYADQGQSGHAIKLFQITPYVNDFQTLNNPASWQPVAALKISFTVHFWDKSFVVDDVKLAELSNNSFEWKNVTW